MPTSTSLVEIDAPGQPGRHRALARVVGAGLAGLLAASVVVTHVGGSPAGAGQDDDPGWVDRNGNRHIGVEVPIDEPGGTGTTAADGPSTPTTLDPNRCEWYSYPDQDRWRALSPEAPEHAIFGEYHCYRDNRPLLGPYVPQWIVPGAEPVVSVSPERVARTLLARLQTTLFRPDPVTSPPEGDPAVVGIPVFFLVANWQGEQNLRECVGDVCVRLIAAPSLTLDPGAPDADTIDCEDRGTRYDPDGPPPDEQAAVDGACAHTYRERTGVARRPDHWDARLRVTWEVSWSGAGQSGSFAPITMVSPVVEMPVAEVSSVVAEAG